MILGSPERFSVLPCQHRTSRMIAVPAGAHKMDCCIQTGSSSSVGIGYLDLCVDLMKRVGPFSGVKSVIRKLTTIKGVGRFLTVTVPWGSFRLSRMSAWRCLNLCARQRVIASDAAALNSVCAPDLLLAGEYGGQVDQLLPLRVVNLRAKRAPREPSIALGFRNGCRLFPDNAIRTIQRVRHLIRSENVADTNKAIAKEVADNAVDQFGLVWPNVKQAGQLAAGFNSETVGLTDLLIVSTSGASASDFHHDCKAIIRFSGRSSHTRAVNDRRGRASQKGRGCSKLWERLLGSPRIHML